MNIIVALTAEIARVKLAIAANRLDPKKRSDAESVIRFAMDVIQQNSLGDMYEALNDLKEIDQPNPEEGKQP